MNRRNFLTKLGLGIAGAIVAPTIAETIAVNAKKYFFIQNNPLSLCGIPYYMSSVSGTWLGFNRNQYPEIKANVISELSESISTDWERNEKAFYKLAYGNGPIISSKLLRIPLQIRPKLLEVEIERLRKMYPNPYKASNPAIRIA